MRKLWLVLFPRNEQYYEAIMAIWNQLYINIKSLISWQYCLKDMNYINSLTVSMVRYHKELLSFSFKITYCSHSTQSGIRLCSFYVCLLHNPTSLRCLIAVQDAS